MRADMVSEFSPSRPSQSKFIVDRSSRMYRPPSAAIPSSTAAAELACSRWFRVL